MSYYNPYSQPSDHQSPPFGSDVNRVHEQQHNIPLNGPYGYQHQLQLQQHYEQPKPVQTHPYVVIPQISPSPNRQYELATPAYSSPSVYHPQVAVLQAPRQQSYSHVGYTPQRSSSLNEPRIKQSPLASTQSLPDDLRNVLVVLADVFIYAAHALLPLEDNSTIWKRYYKLMATGMGCFEVILKMFPREEAEIRLRYALLLFEETKNDLEVEETLSKGIVLCERSRLLDLKYSMTLLLARAVARSKLGAASTTIEKLAEESKVYEHTPWEYAIRFLRVSFAFEEGSNAEKLVALTNLKIISQLAEKKGDNAIYVAAAAYEAILHVRNSPSGSIEQAQEAIASARKLQLSLNPQQYPQLIAMVICADLACSLCLNQPEQMLEKLQVMQDFVDSMNKTSSWSDDGLFGVPIDHALASQLTASTGGVFRKAKDGRDLLILSWLGKKDFYNLGYFLSGICHFFKNHVDTKIERYFSEGLKTIQNSIAVDKKATWQFQLSQSMRLYLILTYCSRGEWEPAQRMINQMDTETSPIATETDSFTNLFLYYIKGTVAQGTGDLVTAEQVYKSKIFTSALQDQIYQGPRRDLAILATLNALIIYHNRTPSNQPPNANTTHTKVDDFTNKPSMTITTLEPLCQHHPNKAIISAYQLAATVANESSTAMQTKQFLRNAIQTAREIGRPQLLALTMNLLSDKFFKDIIGQQTEKCASTGRNLAGKAGDPLWLAVADEMYASVLERSGNGVRAEELRAEGLMSLNKVPVGVRQALDLG